MSQKLRFKTALLWIVLSTFVVSGGAFFFVQVMQKIYQKRSIDPKYNIQYLQLESNSDEPHMGEFFSEALGLSRDEPTNILHFNTKKAAKLLRSFAIIDEAHVTKILPDTIAIRYMRREPFFLLGNCRNYALDRNGYTFPLKPFFTPKKMTKIFFSDPNFHFGETIPEKEFALCKRVFDILHKPSLVYGFELLCIDCSHLNEKSLGKKEIVLIVDNDVSLHWIRLPTDQFEYALNNYLELRSELILEEQESSKKQYKSIDLRIQGLGYLEEIDDDKMDYCTLVN